MKTGVWRTLVTCTSQSLPSGSFHKPLILLHQREDRLKTIITENYPIWSHGPQLCLTQWNHEPCHVGPPKMDGSWWRALTKCGPLEKGMANHFSILALRIPWTVWKGKKIGTERWAPQVGRCPICYCRSVENSRKNEETEPKKKQHPAVDVTGDRSKVQCCKEQYCRGTWNVRSMNQGKLKMSRVNIDILGISKLK